MMVGMSQGARVRRRQGRKPRATSTTSVLHGKRDLMVARQRLARIWRADCVDVGLRTLGHPGHSGKARLHWSQTHRVWGSFPPLGRSQNYWNAFGVDDPLQAESLEIAAEVNTAVKGHSPGLQGLFARQGKRGVILLHRGRFNIGNRGFTRDAVPGGLPRRDPGAGWRSLHCCGPFA